MVLKHNNMEVTLQILKEDINTANYMDSHDCAITRALARAGYPHLRDHGTGVYTNDNTEVAGEGYKELSDRVTRMYLKRTEAESFEHTLNLDI